MSRKPPRVICPILPSLQNPRVLLSKDESHHLTQVLRIPTGTKIEAIDGKGEHCIAQLEWDGKSTFLLFIPPHATQQAGPESGAAGHGSAITLWAGILKGDAFSWLIEKATELGVHRLVPLECEHSVVRIKTDEAPKFVSRWQKISDQSLKQSGRLVQMRIEDPCKITSKGKIPAGIHAAFESATGFWCDELATPEDPSLLSALQKTTPELLRQGVHLFIGPEGGWSTNERAVALEYSHRNKNFRTVRLSSVILRAETAALSAAALAAAWCAELE